ncbi:molybdenum cofactor guanylyltransferase [Phenylobacterium sp.]|jgi:molybdopterin-guanine dinucleotide biosynthesis protein A|uniref:molybdenum cofactor guanylyltransferase n=1 Tax=Phenylobacterium sp. TaxID=1871053 RepID=UPI002F425E75
MALGLVLAGGRSRRFGREKAAAELGGLTLLERAHRRLAAVCSQVAVSAPAGAAAERLAGSLGAPLLPDPYGAPRGPLSGVLAGLDWALGQREELLITLPCDAPLLPDDLEARLLSEIGAAPAAVARTPDGLQPLCALWRTALARPLRAALADGLHPPVHQVLTDANAAQVAFTDREAFLNVNTPADLAEAARRLAARG